MTGATLSKTHPPVGKMVIITSSRFPIGLVATKLHACYLLGGTGWDWVRIPLGLNFSGSAGGVSGHAQSLTGLPGIK